MRLKYITIITLISIIIIMNLCFAAILIPSWIKVQKELDLKERASYRVSAYVRDIEEGKEPVTISVGKNSSQQTYQRFEYPIIEYTFKGKTYTFKASRHQVGTYTIGDKVNFSVNPLNPEETYL